MIREISNTHFLDGSVEVKIKFDNINEYEAFNLLLKKIDEAIKNEKD